MLLKMFKLNKRLNSTLLPTNTDLLISGDVVLKQATSTDKPVFVMACGANDMPKARICNYVEFQGNFFWITDLVQLNNTHIEVSCEIDVLATFRSEILATKAYVLYSASHGNTDTLDDRIVRKCTNKINHNTANTESVMFNDLLSTVMLITNNQGLELVTPYVIDSGSIQYLKSALYDPDFLSFFSQFFSNPLSNVINVKLTPAWITGLGANESIYVGDYELTYNGYPVVGHRISIQKTITHSFYINIPWHYNDFRNKSPYTEMYLYLPFIGYVTLDSSNFYNTEYIRVDLISEICTGNIIYNIYANIPNTEVNILVSTFNGNCAADMPIAQISKVNPATMIAGAGSIVQGAISGNPASLAFGVSAVAQSFQQKTQINGTLSSAIGSKSDLRIILEVWSSETNTQPDKYKDVNGLPYCSTVELSELTGYCKCVDASVSAIAMPEELQKINDYLNGGFYIE